MPKLQKVWLVWRGGLEGTIMSNFNLRYTEFKLGLGYDKNTIPFYAPDKNFHLLRNRNEMRILNVVNCIRLIKKFYKLYLRFNENQSKTASNYLLTDISFLLPNFCQQTWRFVLKVKY